MISVREVMTADVITALESDTAFSAACKMVEHNIGCLVVCAGKKPVGIVTDTDLIKRVICEKTSSFETELREFMSSPVVSAHPLMLIDEVAELMQKNNIKRLPVVDSSSGELVGIVSAKDLIAAEKNMITVLHNYLDSMRKGKQ